jgi:dTDP-4-dehydrorhamnose 3,5-epimerase-like enzyme
MLKDKFKIETLPITKDFLREKRFIEERGELVLLSDGDEIGHITFFTLKPGKTFFRGGHFHKKKTEKFYVVSGKLNILIVDVDTKEKDIIEIIAGQRVTIYPFCAHKFQAVTKSQVIEYYASAYDIDDDIRFTDF